MKDNYKLCFIIALKYYRNYETYIKYYVDNIKKYYEDSFTIIVDNNSKYIENVYEMFKDYKDLIITTNNTECKFELGAYKVGINYLISNNLTEHYNYYIFTQDTFILKNRYDFNILTEKNVLATTISQHILTRNDDSNFLYHDYITRPFVMSILKRLNIENKINNFRLCWGNSFVLHNSKIKDFLDITRDIVVLTKAEACDCERYFSGILYVLNNNKNFKINNYNEDEVFLLWNINPINYETNHYFLKKITNKTEMTVSL